MQIQNKITNLVLEGAGVGAISYAGFFDKVEESGILKINDISRVAGVSSGAIAALQVALNYSPAEMIAVIQRTDFKKFADAPGGIMADVLRLFTEEGIYNDEYLYCYIRELIKAKTDNENLTFHDLQNMKEAHHFKDLYVLATKLFMINNQPEAQAFIFSHEHTPYARVADAIRASASLPIIFPPMRLREEKDGKYTIHSDGNVYVDGGMIESYPITIFDYPRYLNTSSLHVKTQSFHNMIFNHETLGLKLDTHTDITLLSDAYFNDDEQVIQDEFQYARALLYVLRSGQQNINFVNSRNRERTIFVDTLGIASTDFNLTTQQKEDLLRSGRNAAARLIETQQALR